MNDFFCMSGRLLFKGERSSKVLVAKASELIESFWPVSQLGIFNILMSKGIIEVYMYIMCVSACESF